MCACLLAALLFLPAVFAMPALAAIDRIVKLERNGLAPLFYLATVPENSAPRIGVILLVGGSGIVNLADKGIPQPGDSFLLQSRDVFAERGLATATFDPSAESGPLTDEARSSAMHAGEVERVLTDFKRRFDLDRVYLAGTSRGTISAAYLALRFGNRISGVVLAATVFSGSRTGPGLDGFDFSRIKVPLLFVHHRHDGCKVTPPAGAEEMRGRYPVVFIEGGEQEGDECGPFSPHGFLGREPQTVRAISDWIQSQP